MPTSHNHPPQRGLPSINWRDVINILRPRRDPDFVVYALLFIIGMVFSFMPVLGAFWGFRRAYNYLYAGKETPPRLVPAEPIVYACMAAGALLFFLGGYAVYQGGKSYIEWKSEHAGGGEGATMQFIFLSVYMIVNVVISILVINSFTNWQNEIFADLREGRRFGTARLARIDELADLANTKRGMYIGWNALYYERQGHLLTVAGTRGGKGVNLVIPNLLGKSDYTGS
jgi:type IV secretion system protein VirD4